VWRDARGSETGNESDPELTIGWIAAAESEPAGWLARPTESALGAAPGGWLVLLDMEVNVKSAPGLAPGTVGAGCMIFCVYNNSRDHNFEGIKLVLVQISSYGKDELDHGSMPNFHANLALRMRLATVRRRTSVAPVVGVVVAPTRARVGCTTTWTTVASTVLLEVLLSRASLLRWLNFDT
jgi:hypothetical protein